MHERASKTGKILILIADDEVNLLLLLKDNLEEFGFDVVTATNGEEALHQAVQERPDIIVLDVEMPKLNGIQVCERIRGNSELKETPILILSAYAQAEDIKRGLAAGANQYVTKPFKVKQLVDLILTLNRRPAS